MKIKIARGNIITHLIIFIILVGIISFAIGKINIYTLLFPLIFTLFNIYFEEILFHKVTSRRRKKIYKLLFEKYGNGETIGNDYFKSNVNNKNFLFRYDSSISNFRINNSLAIFLEISDLKENIKQLCRIHFHCKKINNNDYIYCNVSSSLFSNSLKRLTKNSEKSVKDIIQKSEKYIAEKESQTSF